MSAEIILSILLGIALSAACGFRVFVPMLVMSIASMSGHLTLSHGFEWIGTIPALLAFAIAMAAEIAGYYVPYVDHLLDVVASPAAVVAGALVMASAVTGMSPFLHWSLSIIAGGGIAATVQSLTAMTRVGSTAITAGLTNPLVSTFETGGSILISVLAIAVPVAAVIAVAILLFLMILPARALSRRLLGKREKGEKP